MWHRFIFLHSFFDFDGDPILPSSLRPAESGLQCLNSGDLDHRESAKSSRQGEQERYRGGLLHFIKIMQWERWISERVHVHERKSSANILLKLDGSSVLCYLVCPSGQAERQRRIFLKKEVVLLWMFLADEGRSFLNDCSLRWAVIMHSLTRPHSCLSIGTHKFSFLFPLLLPDVGHTRHNIPSTVAGSTQWQTLGVPKKEQTFVGTDGQMEPLTVAQKVPENPDFGCSLFPHAAMPFWRENKSHSY